MNLEQRKEQLLQYVLSSMTEDDFERNRRPNKMGFRTYQEFVDHQRDVISQFDEGSVGIMKFLRDSLIPMTKMVDRETMSRSPISGFCFSNI